MVRGGLAVSGGRDGPVRARVAIGGRLLTGLTLVGLPTLYFAAFFNRFAGLRSGSGEYAGGVWLLHDVLPYRDYFTAAPPLNTIKSAFLLSLFGQELVVSRVAGVTERLVICVVLYLWLRRLFDRVPALVASVVTVTLSAADCTDPIASYNHDAILWSILSGLLASWWLAERRRRAALLAAGSGVCAGLAALTKQTVGLAVALVVLLWLGGVAWRQRGGRGVAGPVLPFLGGVLVPVGGVGVLLMRWHVLRSAIEMLFVTGPQAKAGHAIDFVTREFMVAWSNMGWVVLGSAALAAAWRPLRDAFAAGADRAEPIDEGGAGAARLAAVAAGGAAAIGAAEVLAFGTRLPALHDVTKSAVYFTFIGLTMLLSGVAAKTGTRLLRGRDADLLLLTAVSWTIAASLSMSWPAFEAMLLPGLGLLLAALLSRTRGSRTVAALAAIALAVFLSVWEKLDRPFLFDGQQEPPVREATARSKLSQLEGMRLPAATVALLDGTAELVRSNTRPGDAIFTYPEMGLLYALTDRRPPTFAASHNIDVVNDGLAHQEAERLLGAPPKVIVRYRQSEADLAAEEALWRGGARSGQRDLAEAIGRLLPAYDLRATYRIAPADAPVEVYVRR